MVSVKNWLPLESNPDVINKYLIKLGIPAEWGCVDVYAIDKESLSALPKPSVALMMLFPHAKGDGDLCGGKLAGGEQGLFFVKQNIGNACGTIALVHALGNNMDHLKPGDGAFKRFYDGTKTLNAEERAKALEENQEFESAHHEIAQEGQSKAPNPEENVDYHFVTFVQHSGILYELDGRKALPVEHGKTSDATFLEDAANVAKKFMERDANALQFTLLALTKVT